MPMYGVDRVEVGVGLVRYKRFVGRLSTIMREEEVAIDGDEMNVRGDTGELFGIGAYPNGGSEVCHHSVGGEEEALLERVTMVAKPLLDCIAPGSI